MAGTARERRLPVPAQPRVMPAEASDPGVRQQRVLEELLTSASSRPAMRVDGRYM
jgi:hypothetical protein